MNKENPLHHIDKATMSPELAEAVPVERETKIKFIGTREEFYEQLEGLGAKLEQATRQIEDLRYMPSAHFSPGASHELNPDIFSSTEGKVEVSRLVKIFELLGFAIKPAEDGKYFEVISPKDLNGKTVRIRRDGDVWIFTAKARLDENSGNDEHGIEEQPELEVELANPEQLKDFLENSIGLQVESHRQKYRTSFRLKTGQLVELNESPAFSKFNVPFWIEIEGNSLEDIKQGAGQLGFTQEHFFKGSDKRFLKKMGGLSEAQTRELVF